MTNLCQFYDTQGHQCTETARPGGLCYWHDPSAAKIEPDIVEKLEAFVKGGGISQGLQLKRANLAGLDLVFKGGGFYDLSGSDFYRANLQGAHLFNLRLQNGSLMKANLVEAKLNSAVLTGTNMLGIKLKDAKIDNIKIGKHLKQEKLGLEAEKSKQKAKAIDYYEQAEETYREWRKAAETQGLFGLGGHCIKRELRMRRYQLPKLSLNRLLSKGVDLFCGYGEDPLRVVLFSLVVIFFCSILYFFTGVSYNGTEHGVFAGNANLTTWLDALYYSVVTFTTLGYGDITPIGFSRAVAACEAFIGSFTLALFVVVFVKKMTR